MVLFTKEVFLQLKKLTCLNINSTSSLYDTRSAAKTSDQSETWQIYIQGFTDHVQSHLEEFSTHINCASKEDAYRIYKELAQQVVESGTVPELNDNLIDAVLKGE